MENNFLLGKFERTLYHLFYQQGQGLCFREKRGALWGEYKIILRDIAPDFDAAYSGECIHIIGQDSIGTIVYLNYDGADWRKRELLSSKSQTAQGKCFRLLVQNEVISGFHLLNHLGKTLLSHHIISEDDPLPIVLGYADTTSDTFGVCADASQNIHLIYAEGGRAVHKTYFWSKKSWHRRHETGICGANANIYCDGGDIIYYYAKKAEGGYKSFFQRVGGEKILVSTDSVLPRPSVFRLGDILYFALFLHGECLVRESDDGGKTWVKTPFAKLFSPRGAALGLKLRIPGFPSAVLPGVAVQSEVKPFFLPPPAQLKNNQGQAPPNLEESPTAAPSELEINLKKMEIKIGLLEDEIREIKASLPRAQPEETAPESADK